MMGSYPVYERYKDSGVEWLGEIPEHWDLKKIQYISRLKSGESITSNQIEKDGNFPVFGGNGLRGYYDSYTHDGDYVLIGRQGALCGNINYASGRFWASEHAVVVHNTTNLNVLWLGEILRTMNLGQYSTSAAQPGISVENIGRLKLPFPPLEEQETIARFLDYKTRQIDALIAKKEALLEKLEEKRSALISHAVTKGLDRSVPMKDSGVEWLGEIPEHWKSVRLTKYLQSLVDYRGKTPEKVSHGVFLVTAKNIKNGIIDYSLSQEFVKEEDYEQIMGRGKPSIGDVLLTTEAPLGEVANIDNVNIALAQRVIKMQGKTKILDNFFLKNWMLGKHFNQNLQSLCTGSTALGIKASKLCLLRLVLPPIEEQKMINLCVDQKTAEIDQQKARVEKAIALLKEYRTALITNAVTGKIDVRSVPLPTQKP